MVRIEMEDVVSELRSSELGNALWERAVARCEARAYAQEVERLKEEKSE